MQSHTVIVSIIVIYLFSSEAVNITDCGYGGRQVINAVFEHKGDIYSPNFGKEYADNLYCMYTIRTAALFKIKLTIRYLDIEPFENCGKDTLSIYDGLDQTGEKLATICGSEPPPPIITPRNGVYITFTTNFLGGRTGFHIEYEAGPDLEQCPKGYKECKNRECYKEEDKCNGKDDCGDGTDEEYCGFPLSNPKCGVNPIKPIESSYYTDRVVGGIEARPGSWPWQADLQLKYAYPNSHVCGGALINPQWLITATHCIAGSVDPAGWRIHLGNHNKFKKDVGEQVRYVERIIIYPGFTNEEIKTYEQKHDFALMKLTAPVEITDYVRPACLPPSGYEMPVGTRCIASGWGESRGSGFGETLKQTEIAVQHEDECPGFMVKETMICIKSVRQNQGVCHGDSGGPLNCKLGDTWHVMGVTSFGVHTNLMSFLCGLPGPGTIYNKASNKTTWVHEMIEKYS